MKKRLLLTLFLMICFLFGVNLAGTKEMRTVSAVAKGTVTTDNLRVRTKAGTDKPILTYKNKNVLLAKNTSVTIKAQTKVGKVIWYMVSFNYEGKTLNGYVSSEYIKTNITNSQTSSATISVPAKVVATQLNVRKKPDKTAEQLVVSKTKVALDKGTSVTIRQEIFRSSEKWYYISFQYKNKTQKGYVLSNYVKLNLSKKVSAVVKSDKAVAIRTGAGDKKSYLIVNKKKVSLKNKKALTIIKEVTDSKETKWFQVQFTYENKKRTGYIPANKVSLQKQVTSATKPEKEPKPPVTAKKEGTVTTDGLRVRTGAGTDKQQLAYNGVNVTLTKGQKVTIQAEKKVGKVIWYKVSFTYQKKTLTGYVSGDYILIGDSSNTNEKPKPTEKPDSNEKPKPIEKPDSSENSKPTEKPDSSDKPKPTEKPDSGENSKPTEKPETITNIDSYLKEQGFPESYKAALKQLHNEHPNWIFKAYKTGLDWNTVIEKESRVGLNLISVNKADGWKSYAEGAYNWGTDKFIPYDGSTWVTASKEAVEYYMDPRNFLFERGIFQFATLEYESSYENKDGVEKILANTPLYNTKYAYKEDGKSKSILFSNTFIDAAKESGVSPFHLATRVKQEVVLNSTTLSGSASGKYSGYEGYYNFYNIGATHSTAAGGAVMNGLRFAQGLKSTSADQKTYLLPWDSQYKAIVGGAKYIGKQYINRGQNTIYLQKFNVTGTSTYSHQYMANVEAPNSEAIKLYNGYTSVLDSALVFTIPVYENMPSSKCSTPGTVKNPNNWLKTLKLDESILTPEFIGSKTSYSAKLKDSNDDNLKVTAEPVSSKATMKITYKSDGKTTEIKNQDKIKVALGDNILTIQITAENKTTKTYQVIITK